MPKAQARVTYVPLQKGFGPDFSWYLVSRKRPKLGLSFEGSPKIWATAFLGVKGTLIFRKYSFVHMTEQPQSLNPEISLKCMKDH